MFAELERRAEIYDAVEKATEKAFEKGIAKSQEDISSLIKAMCKAGRSSDEIVNALMNPESLPALFRQFGIGTV